MLGTVKTAIMVVVDVVKTAAELLTGTKFAMIMPLPRPSSSWYTTRFEDIRKIYGDAIDGLSLANSCRFQSRLVCWN